MSSFIHEELHKRFNEMQNERAAVGVRNEGSKKVKSVIALALDEYITTKHEKYKTPLEEIQLDNSFASIAVNQIRLFIFAGNDTTATALVYVYHMPPPGTLTSSLRCALNTIPSSLKTQTQAKCSVKSPL